MTKKLPPVFEQKLRATRKAERRICRKAIVDQVFTHTREIAALLLEVERLREAVREMVQQFDFFLAGGRLDYAKGKWTPAEKAKLEEWRKLVS